MDQPSYAEITYEVSEQIATITLNRPAARNGYTLRMSDELRDGLLTADRDPQVRVVILTGAGRDFCVGADLSQGGFNVTDPGSGDSTESGGWQEPAGRASRTINEMNTPVIAAMRGAAVGGGLTITLSADFRLGSTDSTFGLVFARRGIFPEGGSVWYLPQIVGRTKAQDWMVTGRLFGADEALASGLLTSVHEPDEVLDAAWTLARNVRDNTAGVSVAVIRQMLARLSGLDSPDTAHEIDSRLIADLPHHRDASEGVMSFLQKRPPKFPLSAPADIPTHLPWVRGR